MTTLTLTTRDATTMVRRNLLHQQRYLGLTLMMVLTPVIVLLLFVYVFGGTMGAGLPGVDAAAGRQEYLAFVMPGILLLGVAMAGQSVAISVATDTTSGIVARFRTMSISRGAFLTGHVVGNLLQMLLAGLVVVGVAIALGFRPDAGPLGWLAVAGTYALVSLMVIWLAAAMGLQAKTVEGASNTPMVLMLLPFLSSGFVPTETLPTGLRWFAEYQPFTAITDLLRALLHDQPVGDAAWQTVAWCLGLALGGCLWAVRNYESEPTN
jgi:ABC-2 type transport system permease protein